MQILIHSAKEFAHAERENTMRLNTFFNTFCLDFAFEIRHHLIILIIIIVVIDEDAFEWEAKTKTFHAISLYCSLRPIVHNRNQ